MSTINDGGPAFPVQYSNEAGGPTVMPAEGMSLREYMAVHASEADIAAQLDAASQRLSESAANPIGLLDRSSARWRVVARYMHADAMLAARSKTAGGAA